MAEQKSSSTLAAPLHGATSVLRRVPGVAAVGRATQGTLDKVGAVSPRGRRLAVYTGAGVLGVAGVVEWPVALTGAAVVWLTQPRPEQPADGGEQAQTPAAAAREPAKKRGTPAKKRGTATREASPDVGTGSEEQASAPDTDIAPEGQAEQKTKASTASQDKSPKGQAATGPLGPTARPDRTSL
ncbi:hypothetical protein [Streptomyces sp. NPDC087437]|uniref:hypothetical protein n=1 Tax=Streptomyces sp. NPDC087437 TaxID=3365789 RepID=UPI003814023B